jgi:glycogen synthase
MTGIRDSEMDRLASNVKERSGFQDSRGSATRRILRLVYSAGPGDIVGTYKHWRQGCDDPTQVSVTYSGQFYDICQEFGAAGYAISSHERREDLKDGRFRIAHRRIYFREASGALYHIGQFWRALHITAVAIAFRADALVIGEATYWFPLQLLPWFGTAVIPTVHCVFRKRCAPSPTLFQRLLLSLNRPFWSRSATCILSAAPEISRQIDEISRGRHPPVIQFLPTYRRETFLPASPPPASNRPFRVLFVGRIEVNKGVFDLLEIATRYKAAGLSDIEFDLCGTGSALEALRRWVEDTGLKDHFRLHGHCVRTKMREMFQSCHVVIVPTTSDFVEGFNQVVVEGILAGRPVITSAVCPAIEYVREAVVEVPPDDVSAYQGAILTLMRDKDLYEAKRRAGARLQEQFYDESRGWAAALRRALIYARTGASEALT